MGVADGTFTAREPDPETLRQAYCSGYVPSVTLLSVTLLSGSYGEGDQG